MKLFAQTTKAELETLFNYSEEKYRELQERKSIVEVGDGSIIVVLDDIPLAQLQTNIFQQSQN